MRINQKIRKKCINRILARLNKKMNYLNKRPYGHEDPMVTYELIEYWESKLNCL